MSVLGPWSFWCSVLGPFGPDPVAIRMCVVGLQFRVGGWVAGWVGWVGVNGSSIWGAVGHNQSQRECSAAKKRSYSADQKATPMCPPPFAGDLHASQSPSHPPLTLRRCRGLLMCQPLPRVHVNYSAVVSFTLPFPPPKAISLYLYVLCSSICHRLQKVKSQSVTKAAAKKMHNDSNKTCEYPGDPLKIMYNF